ALKLQPCIKLFCEQNNLSKYDLTTNEWKRIQQLCDFLQPLNKAKNIISPDKTVTLVLVAPVYIWLIENIISVRINLYSMNNLIVTEIFYQKASIPLFNMTQSLDRNPCYFQMWSSKVYFYKQVCCHQEQITSKNAISNILYKKKKQNITSLDEEIDQYLNAKCEEEAHHPLAFWKSNSEQFPSNTSKLTFGIGCLSREGLAGYQDQVVGVVTG
ncbi:uncharacterized protein VP01_7742g1, partial [Puccinia sorghi]